MPTDGSHNQRPRLTFGIIETGNLLVQVLGKLHSIEYLNEAFLERMGKKFDETRRSYVKSFTFVLTAWVLLLLSTATIPFTVSFLGFTVTHIDLHNVREIVLVVAASMSSYYIIRVLQMIQIKMVVGIAAGHIYGTDRFGTELIAQSYLTLDDNWLAFGTTRGKPAGTRGWRKALIISIGILFLFFVGCVFLAWEGMQLFVIYHVFAEPRTFAFLSYAAGSYAIFMNLIVLGLMGYYLIPFRKLV